MTKLPTGKPLVRETDVFERGDALVVELHPKYLTVRVKGRPSREAVDVSYDAIRQLGIMRPLAGRAQGRRP
jgi:hypothetical protein